MGLIHFGERRVAPVDILVAATGLSANLPDGFDASGDGLPVNEDLSWTGDGSVFAVGDCARMVDHPRPRLGVFGVRQAQPKTDRPLRTRSRASPWWPPPHLHRRCTPYLQR